MLGGIQGEGARKLVHTVILGQVKYALQMVRVIKAGVQYRHKRSTFFHSA